MPSPAPPLFLFNRKSGQDRRSSHEGGNDGRGRGGGRGRRADSAGRGRTNLFMFMKRDIEPRHQHDMRTFVMAARLHAKTGKLSEVRGNTDECGSSCRPQPVKGCGDKVEGNSSLLHPIQNGASACAPGGRHSTQLNPYSILHATHKQTRQQVSTACIVAVLNYSRIIYRI